MDALFLIAKVAGIAAIFVVSVGMVERHLGAGYGRPGKLHPRVVEVVSVVAGFVAVFLALFAVVWLRWF